MQTNKLGLIGGMGPESTIEYYNRIVYGVQKKIGSFPNLTIESVDLFKVVELCQKKNYDDLTNYLLKAIENTQKVGAQFAALTANTPHIVFDRLQEKTTLKLISIVDATLKQALRCDYKKVGLLGTIFTMENDFYSKTFASEGIEIYVPDKDERQFISDKIYSELEFGVVRDKTQKEFIKIITGLVENQGIEAVILGCTELPMILNEDITPVPCIDTMDIHVREIIAAILSPSTCRVNEVMS